MTNMALLTGAAGAAGLVGLYCVLKGKGAAKGASEYGPYYEKLHKLLPQKGDSKYKVVTLEDLKAHDFPEEGQVLDTPKRCWIMMYGVIFDVRDYMEWHPGGASILADQVELLAEYAKKNGEGALPDCHEEFEPYHGEETLREVAGLLPGADDKTAVIYVGHYEKSE